MRVRLRHILWVIVASLTVGAVQPVPAQIRNEQPAQLEGLGVDEQLGEQVPGELTFVDAAGETVQLADYFGGDKPILLTLVYHDCPMLCSVVLDLTTDALGELAWSPGEEFEILTVSFNAIETPALAAQQKDRYVAKLGREGAAAGWHFLTGEQTAIDRLTDAVGFDYRWVEEAEQFAHPAALIFLSPDGTVTRYLNALNVTARDLRLALFEASDGTVGSPLDQVLQFCFQYDPAANSYVAHATNLMKIGGVIALLILGLVLVTFWRREANRLPQQPA